MLTTLSILSPDQGKLQPSPRSEAEYFRSFANAADGDATAPDVALLPRLVRFFRSSQQTARGADAHQSGL